jgi:hypothetical protein
MTYGALCAVIFGVVLAAPLGMVCFFLPIKYFRQCHKYLFFNCSTLLQVCRALIYLAIFLVFPFYKAKLDVYDPEVLKSYEPCVEEDFYKIVELVNNTNQGYKDDIDFVLEWMIILCFVFIIV